MSMPVGCLFASVVVGAREEGVWQGAVRPKQIKTCGGMIEKYTKPCIVVVYNKHSSVCMYVILYMYITGVSPGSSMYQLVIDPAQPPLPTPIWLCGAHDTR